MRGCGKRSQALTGRRYDRAAVGRDATSRPFGVRAPSGAGHRPADVSVRTLRAVGRGHVPVSGRPESARPLISRGADVTSTDIGDTVRSSFGYAKQGTKVRMHPRRRHRVGEHGNLVCEGVGEFDTGRRHPRVAAEALGNPGPAGRAGRWLLRAVRTNVRQGTSASGIKSTTVATPSPEWIARCGSRPEVVIAGGCPTRMSAEPGVTAG